MKEKKKKESVIPNRLAWFIYVTGCRLYMWFHNKVRIDRSVFRKRDKKEGCIVIYNHSSNKDHFITTMCFGHTRAAYVTSSHFYFNKTYRMLLNWVRAIPKEQFKSDIATIKKIKRALQKNLPVSIAPAGQITVHGDPLYIDPSIVKLLKMCKVDVYAIQMHGNYYAYPKWRKYRRKLPIYAKFVKVMDKNDLEHLSDEEIYHHVCDAIAINDRKEQAIYQYQLTSAGLIEGIESILYQCPKCMSKYRNQTTGDTLTCTVCGNQIRMNHQGFLEPVSTDVVMMQNEAEWYKWEQHKMQQAMEKGDFWLEGKFKLLHNLNHSYILEEVGEGKVVLTMNELYYEGTFQDQWIRKDFKLERLQQLPFEVRKHFDIPDDDGCFEFIPAEGEQMAKITEFVQAIEVMSKMRKQ